MAQPPARAVAVPERAGNSRPTAEFLRHHDVQPPDVGAVRFRPAWLVRSRLLQLREHELINEPQLDAACRWRADHDCAHNRSGGMVGGFRPRVDGGWRNGVDLPGLQLDALRRLRETAVALGQTRSLILLRLIVHDDSWRALGRTLGINNKTAQIRAVETLYALHCHQSGVAVPRVKTTRSYMSPGRR